MCDYSLGGIPNRLAAEGEELVVYRFPTQAIGLASPADLSYKSATPDQGFWQRIKSAFSFAPDHGCVRAVCIPPGASLTLKNIPRPLQRKWTVAEEESVEFNQISAEVNTYRDAIRFHNGRQVLLQDLLEGMRVSVTSLGTEPFELPREFEHPFETTQSR